MTIPAEDGPSHVLVIAAHPDDIDFGAAGSVATWVAEGRSVSYLIVTDGDAGGFDAGVGRVEMASLRRAEQQEAGAIVGVSDIRFLGYPDGEVVADLSLRRAIARVIRSVRPDRVLCPSPERDFSRLPASHPDHLAVGEASLCAIYPDARNPFAFPELLEEGLLPHVVHDIWMMASPRADHFVDITAVIDKKLDALAAHKSQLPEPERTMEMVREWTGSAAQRAGFGNGRFAESFFVASLG